VEHGGDLITTVALGLSAAFAAGFIAGKLRLPSIVGYLLAGVALGPFTPGLIANQEIATELAEIGVIQTVEGERELAVQMARYTLRRFGVTSREVEAIAQGPRRRPEPAGAV
jgi:hypothetical protein